MLDINGYPVTVKAEPGYHGYGTRLFSICTETRAGKRRFVATWLPTNNTARFATKREAVAFVKAHEAIAYGR